MAVTLTQLRYLVALAESDSFRSAAARCGITQPTLSAQLAKLEADLGITAVDRSRKPLAVTPEGARLVDDARAVLRATDALVETAQQASSRVAGTFRLGVIPTVAPTVLTRLLPALARVYPELRLSVAIETTARCEFRMLDGTLDGALLATPLHAPTLSEAIVFHEPLVIYGSPEVLPQAPALNAQQLAVLPWHLLGDGHCLRYQTLSICPVESGANAPSTIWQLHGAGLDTLLPLVDAGGATLLPWLHAARLTPHERQQRVRTFADCQPMRQISLVRHRRQAGQKLADAIIATLRNELPAGLQRPLPPDAVVVEPR